MLVPCSYILRFIGFKSELIEMSKQGELPPLVSRTYFEDVEFFDPSSIIELEERMREFTHRNPCCNSKEMEEEEEIQARQVFQKWKGRIVEFDKKMKKIGEEKR